MALAVWPQGKRPLSSSGDKLVDVLERSQTPARFTKSPVQIGLPVVGESERAAPNFWLRSSLFGVTQKLRPREGPDRLYRQGTWKVATPWTTAELEYTGYVLDQSDLDLMLQIVHMATTQGAAGRPVTFTDRSILKAIGKGYGGAQVKWLDEAAIRLTASTIVVRESEKKWLAFHLVDVFGRGNQERVFLIREPALKLFMNIGWTALQWEARLALKGDLTKWLHGYLTSQPTTANGVSLERLKALCGCSPNRLMKLFKLDIKRALAQIPLLGQPGADLHLGLQSAQIVDGKTGPKLVWACDPNRQESMRVLREQEDLRALRAHYQEED
jgi:hypothetical protein